MLPFKAVVMVSSVKFMMRAYAMREKVEEKLTFFCAVETFNPCDITTTWEVWRYRKST